MLTFILKVKSSETLKELNHLLDTKKIGKIIWADYLSVMGKGEYRIALELYDLEQGTSVEKIEEYLETELALDKLKQSLEGIIDAQNSSKK